MSHHVSLYDVWSHASAHSFAPISLSQFPVDLSSPAASTGQSSSLPRVLDRTRRSSQQGYTSGRQTKAHEATWGDNDNTGLLEVQLSNVKSQGVDICTCTSSIMIGPVLLYSVKDITTRFTVLTDCVLKVHE